MPQFTKVHRFKLPQAACRENLAYRRKLPDRPAQEHYKKAMKTMRGFTLLEVMIVVAILGIFAAIALPNFREMTANSRQMATAHALTSTFHYAKEQATFLHRDVRIDAINNDWINGWTVTALQYIETDLTGNTVTHPEKTLMRHNALPGELKITATLNTLTFTTAGWLRISSTKTITICDKRTGETGRVLSIAPIGSISTSFITCG